MYYSQNLKTNLKRLLFYSSLILCFGLLTCTDKDDLPQAASINLNFQHFWENDSLSNADFNDFKFSTEAGNLISIERLRYVISHIQLTDNNGLITEFNEHHLIDVTNANGLNFSLNNTINSGSYHIQLTFGLNNTYNALNHPDLNAASFNVPEMLGGGYHYMQLDGKFINNSNSEQGYNYHAIRAVDISSGNPVFPKDTFFTIDLGTIVLRGNTHITINANMAEWFKNPNHWDLNVYNSVLMPNPEAQIMMFENGSSVFSLNSVTYP